MATAGSSPNNVSPGYYYYSGTSWIRLIIPTDQVAGVKGTVTLVDGTAIPSASSIDNFNLGDYSFFKITGIVTSNINGFSNGVEGRLIVVLNSIDRNQTFMQEAITSTSSNRFVLGVSNLTLAINRTATFIYSSGLTVNSVSGQSRWVLIAH
jgi:hypothetical protein